MVKFVSLYGEVKCNSSDINRMTSAQLNEELERGYADMRAGRTIPAKEVFADIRKKCRV